MGPKTCSSLCCGSNCSSFAKKITGTLPLADDVEKILTLLATLSETACQIYCIRHR